MRVIKSAKMNNEDQMKWHFARLPSIMRGLLPVGTGLQSWRKSAILTLAYCRKVWNQIRDPWFQDFVKFYEEMVHGDTLFGRETTGQWLHILACVSKTKPRIRSLVLSLQHPRIIPTMLLNKDLPHGTICDVMRDVFGDPFAEEVQIDPRWLSSTVLDLAKTINDNRFFERMPILADALMDAGCDNEDILRHCHGFAPCICYFRDPINKDGSLKNCNKCNNKLFVNKQIEHVQGCWVLEMLMGKFNSREYVR